MRKYKQVKEKKVIYSLDEWAVIEHRAAKLSMKTGTYIKRISVDGEIKYYSVGDIMPVMNALRIIGKNINQIAKKANETHSVKAATIEELRKEVDALSRTLSQLVFTAQSPKRASSHLQLSLHTRSRKNGQSYLDQFNELYPRSEMCIPCNEDCVRTIFGKQIRRAAT